MFSIEHVPFMLSKTVLKTSLLVYFLLKHVTFDFVALFTGSYYDLSIRR